MSMHSHSQHRNRWLHRHALHQHALHPILDPNLGECHLPNGNQRIHRNCHGQTRDLLSWSRIGYLAESGQEPHRCISPSRKLAS
jgi:hypothetical protein